MAGTRNKAKLDEVRDEEGRRRFHGAFTGGFSAGYYNSVGSKEGWQPRTWQSSRGARGAPSAQRPEDFMDDEDGLLGRDLEAQLPYDTLGEQARQLVRAHAGRQAAGAAIPGIEAVDELLVPTGVAIGKKLLQLMGWKEGLGVGVRQMRKRRRGQGAAAAAAEGAEDEDDDDAAAFLPEHLRVRAAERGLVEQGRITFARRDVESFALPALKDDLYGLGFDPDKHAPEFAALREAARARDDRGVYRMGDVKGQASSSRAGPRDATGFAHDDSEDDVYDADAPLAMLRKDKSGGGGGGPSSRYDTVLRGLDEDEEDEEEEARGRRGGKDAGSAHRMALEEWIDEAGVSAPPAASSRCPTDSRPVPEGFVLGVARWAFKQAFWAPPTPPRNFVPFHRFEEEDEGERQGTHAAAVAGQRDAHRGRLVASARGTLLGEAKPEPPREGSSVFDLMSEADRGRLLGKAQAVLSGGDGAAGGAAAPTPPAPPMGLAQGEVFQGMQGALAKRFSVVEAPKTATLPEGLIEGGKVGVGSFAPSVAQPPPPPSPKPLKEPTRSRALWYPGSLLCKRFGIPVPQHAKFTPAAGSGAGAGARAGGLPPGAPPAAPSSLLSNKFDQEMAAILPGGNLLAQQQQQQQQAEAGENEVVEGEGAGGEEASLPAFEAKPRPAKDFFKAIFEESDSEEESDEEGDESDEEEGGNGKKPAAAMGGAIKPEVQDESEPKLAGDAPTAPRPGASTGGAKGGDASPPRDHFLQPAAVAEGESIEEILARGPVLIPRKKRAAAPAASSRGGDEDEEEEEGLIFGAAVIKKQPKKRPKPAATAAAPTRTPAVAVSSGPGATPPGLRGGDETPPPGSTLSAQAGVPPTPPRVAAVAASGAEEALAILLAPAAVPPVLKREDGEVEGSGSSSEDGSEGGAVSASKQGRDKGKERGSSSRSRHKEKKRRKESKNSKKRKHKKEEQRSRRDDDDCSSDDGRRRDRKKRSKHSHSHRR